MLEIRIRRALEMLHGFDTVGSCIFDLTCTSLADRSKTVFRKGRALQTLAAQLPVILPTADSREWNVIVRPHAGQGRVLIQLDDLDRVKLHKVRPVSFLTIETSPGSFQAWVAVDGVPEPERLIRGVRRAAGADIHASGAVRLAGTKNFKLKYAPAFPTVALVEVYPGKIVTEQDLSDRLLVTAEPPDAAPRYAPRAIARQGERKRALAGVKIPPSYDRCLSDSGPARSHEGPDRSQADFLYALIAADRGFTPEEVTELLLSVSERSTTHGRRYAAFTAKRAADIVARRKASGSQKGPQEEQLPFPTSWSLRKDV